MGTGQLEEEWTLDDYCQTYALFLLTTKLEVLASLEGDLFLELA